MNLADHPTVRRFQANAEKRSAPVLRKNWISLFFSLLFGPVTGFVQYAPMLLL